MNVPYIHSVKCILILFVLALLSCTKDDNAIVKDSSEDDAIKDIEWTTQLSFEGKNTRPISMIEIKNRGYLILRYSTNIGSGGSYASLSFIDIEGKEIWSKDYEDLRGSVTSNLVPFNDNYAFFSGREIVICNSNGVILNTIDLTILSGDFNLSGNCGLKSSSDGLILFSYSGGTIAKINLSGEIAWNKMYKKMISDVTELSDNSYVFTTYFNYNEGGYGTFLLDNDGEYTDSLKVNGMLVSADKNQNLFLFDYTERSEYYRIKLKKTNLNGEEQANYEYAHSAYFYWGQHIFPDHNLFSFIGSAGIHIVNFSDENKVIHEYKCGSINATANTSEWNRAWFGLTPTSDGGFILARKAVQEASSQKSIIVINKYK